ncbi:MAG: hypothetical protein ACRBCT_07435 [Alphaproteobacteria bacterium]
MPRILLAVFLMVFAVPAMAEEDAAQSVRERINTMSADLNDNQKAHFMAVTGSSNLISVVKIVQDDVGNAVKACAKENPDLAGAIKGRHKEWQAALAPILKEAQANVDNMIKVQGYHKASDVRKLLKFMEEKRREKAADIDKVPVTTPEACEYLRNKMDETEDQLSELLRSTLVSLPQNLQQKLQEQEVPADEDSDAAAAE